MAHQTVLEKRSYESILYDFDCTDDLSASETISSVATVTSEPTGLTFGTAVINTSTTTYPDGRSAAAGKAIQVRISGGTNGVQYKIRARYATNLSNSREATTALKVRD